MQKKKIAEVAKLINAINETLKEMQLNDEDLSLLIDRDIMSERLKQDHIKDVIRELEYLAG